MLAGCVPFDTGSPMSGLHDRIDRQDKRDGRGQSVTHSLQSSPAQPSSPPLPYIGRPYLHTYLGVWRGVYVGM